MRSHQAGALLLAEAAASAGTPSERAQPLLEVLRRVVPFDAAFLAFADPLGDGYHSLASVDLDGRAVEFLSGPQVARDIEATGTDRARPPLGPSDLPYPAEDLPTWAECLIPAGLHEGLGVALFAPGGRHVGHLAVLSGSRQRPSPSTRRRLGRLAPLAGARCRPDALGADRRTPGAGRHRRRAALRGRRLPGPAGHAGGRAAGRRLPRRWPPRATGSANARSARRSCGRWAARTPPEGTCA